MPGLGAQPTGPALPPQAPRSAQPGPLGDRHQAEPGVAEALGPGPRHALDLALDGLVLDEEATEALGLAGPLVDEVAHWAQSHLAPPLGRAAFRSLGEAFGG